MMPSGHKARVDYSHLLGTLAISGSNLLSGHLSRKQQERLAQQNRELQLQIEKNRQNFQLQQSERNASLQRELCQKNHELRLMEQKSNSENLRNQAEWNLFLKTWPLLNVPSVIRSEQILPDGTVSLRVIFARSSDQVFQKAVYPLVEEGLREFVDLYHNEFQSENILFYHNGFTGSVSGGAVAENIHYALSDLPVIVIETNTLFDEVCVSFTMWGLADSRKRHFTVFKLPYEPHVANGAYSVQYYSELALQLLAHLKFVLGYAYDAYNLVQYDRPPLLPQVVWCEPQLGTRGCVLHVSGMCDTMEEKYEELYDQVLGARALEGLKGCRLHKLRMEYAEASRRFLPAGQFQRCLDESVEAWVALRTQDQSAEAFLNGLATGDLYLSDYAGEEDRQYLEAMAKMYNWRSEGYSPVVCYLSDKANWIRRYPSYTREHTDFTIFERGMLSDEDAIQYLNYEVREWVKVRSNWPPDLFLFWLGDGRHTLSREDLEFLKTLSRLYDCVPTPNKGAFSRILNTILALGAYTLAG